MARNDLSILSLLFSYSFRSPDWLGPNGYAIYAKTPLRGCPPFQSCRFWHYTTFHIEHIRQNEIALAMTWSSSYTVLAPRYM